MGYPHFRKLLFEETILHGLPCVNSEKEFHRRHSSGASAELLDDWEDGVGEFGVDIQLWELCLPSGNTYLVVHPTNRLGGLVHIGDFNGISVGASRPRK